MIHKCHWPGCTIPVAPKLWGWFKLPAVIRAAIWKQTVSDDVEPEDPRIKFGSDKLSADLYDPAMWEWYQEYYWERWGPEEITKEAHGKS